MRGGAEHNLIYFTTSLTSTRFDWDPNKDVENQEKHGVSLRQPSTLSRTPRRVIAEDLDHSVKEKRYYCFGMAGGGVLTVRFTFRGAQSASLARAIGGGAGGSMSAKIKYTDERIGKVKVVPDFLPPSGKPDLPRGGGEGDYRPEQTKR